MRRRLRTLTVLLACGVPVPLHAELVRIEVARRVDLAGGRSFGLAGPYEKLVGKAHFEVDPERPANRAVADISRAPRNARGRVEFAADVCILRPKETARSSGTLLLEIPNRGRKLALATLQRARGSNDPTSEAEVGDALLLDAGWTLAWVGWQFDTPDQKELMRLYAPTAADGGRKLTGLVRADYVFGRRVETADLAERGHRPYPVSDPADPANSLSVRDAPLGPRRGLPRDTWQFTLDGTRIRLAGGFQPGMIYELVYRAEDPPVAGLGLAAVRDLVSYLKQRPDAVAPVRRALAIGFSQSGRFLRHFLSQGFNADEAGRPVFDGVFDHVAGAGRGSFNHRFAQPSRDGQSFQSFFYPTDVFPFSDLEAIDPETGRRDGLLVTATAAGVQPKIFYTNSSHEYWGRCAALVHTTLDGRADMPLPETVRIYLFAGGQHGPAAFPPAPSADPDYRTQLALNPNDYGWSMRALVLALERWVREGTAPPESRYPRVADGTLVPVENVAFPKIPGVTLPRRPKQAWRIDYGPRWAEGIIDQEPPRIGKAFPILVPQVDGDGTDRAGVRMPEVAVPLATYTGWNLRHPAIGGAEELSRLVGAFIPFAGTRAEREPTRDPRPSIEERYRSRAEYVGLAGEAALELVRGGYLLARDVPALLERAGAQWDHAVRRPDTR